MKSNSLAKRIGARVKALREDERDPKVTQTDLAEQLTQMGHRVGQGMIGHVEVGVKMPSLPLLIALARRFSTSTDYVLGLTNNPLSIADLEEEARGGGVSGQLGEILARLEDGARADLLAVARRLDRQSVGQTPAEFEESLFESLESRFGSVQAEEIMHELARFLPAVQPDAVDKQRPA